MAKALKILGPDGKPLVTPKRDLVERTARPSLVGYRRAQQWRSVVTGLTPQRLRYLLHSVAQGTWTPDFFELAEEMEERDLHYRGVLQQRKLKAAGAPMDVIPASDDPLDQEIAEHVRTDLLDARTAHRARVELLDACGKGFSCQEITWTMRDGRWMPAAFYRVDQRWLTFDLVDGETPYLIGDRSSGAARADTSGAGVGHRWSASAQPLMPGKFLYHAHHSKSGLPGRGGLAYAAATMYLLKSVAVKDWWALGEVFGLPVRVGKYGPNASDDDIQTLIDAIAMIASDAGAVIPDSMTVEFIQAARAGGGSGEQVLFEGMADWCDAQVSKAVVGQTMTVEDGASLSQAKIHADIRDDIVDDDVAQMCNTLSDTLVPWYCAFNFMPRPAGWPRLAPPADEDAIDVTAVTVAVKAGLRVGQTWMRERMGIPEPAGDEEILSGTPPGAPAPDDDGDDEPPVPGPNALSFHAADDPLDESAWLGLADEMVAPVLDALDAAGDADEFLSLASRAELPQQFARDLALRCFEARIEGETERER